MLHSEEHVETNVRMALKSRSPLNKMVQLLEPCNDLNINCR